MKFLIIWQVLCSHAQEKKLFLRSKTAVGLIKETFLMPIKTGVAVTQENVSGKLCWLSAPANITLQGWKTCSNFTNEQVKIAKNKKI